MHSQPINLEKFDELLRFLPLFDVPNREFIKQWNNGYPVYSEDVEQFFSLVSQDYWCDYNYNPNGVSKMLENDEFINQAKLEDIKTMLTYCVRGERFCDGHWGAVLKNGRIIALLKRLKNISTSNK